MTRKVLVKVYCTLAFAFVLGIAADAFAQVAAYVAVPAPYRVYAPVVYPPYPGVYRYGYAPYPYAVYAPSYRAYRAAARYGYPAAVIAAPPAVVYGYTYPGYAAYRPVVVKPVAPRPAPVVVETFPTPAPSAAPTPELVPTPQSEPAY